MSDTSTQQHQSAATPGSKQSGNVLTHKLGPLPVWAWGAVVIGAIILYKYLHDRNTASSGTPGSVTGQNNANSIFGTEGFSVNGQGQIVDNATGAIVGTSGSSSGSNGSTSSVGSWLANMQQNLFSLGFNSAAVDQALQDYSAGIPLPQSEYNIIESGIKLAGNPPSGMALPTLQKAAAASPGPAPTPAPAAAPAPTNAAVAGPPGLPSSIINAMTANGEYIVSTAYQPVTGTWLYLTQKGGVYAEGGSGFFGSLFNTPSGTFAGRTASQIVASNTAGPGGYTVIDTKGETYNFGPNANYAGK